MIIRLGKQFHLAANLGKDILESGGLVIYPTETSYGLGCKATSRQALRKIFKIKKRDMNKKLPVIVADKKMALAYFKLNKNAIKLIDKFMPGPLTLIAEAKNKMPPEIGGKKIAFRISSNKFASELSKAINCPIASTSANISGKGNIYEEKKLTQFYDFVDVIFSAGNLKKEKPSTIYDSIENKMVRNGPISKKIIEKTLGIKIG